jgi:hypothetical protein
VVELELQGMVNQKNFLRKLFLDVMDSSLETDETIGELGPLSKYNTCHVPFDVTKEIEDKKFTKNIFFVCYSFS